MDKGYILGEWKGLSEIVTSRRRKWLIRRKCQASSPLFPNYTRSEHMTTPTNKTFCPRKSGNTTLRKLILLNAWWLWVACFHLMGQDNWSSKKWMRAERHRDEKPQGLGKMKWPQFYMSLQFLVLIFSEGRLRFKPMRSMKFIWIFQINPLLWCKVIQMGLIFLKHSYYNWVKLFSELHLEAH